MSKLSHIEIKSLATAKEQQREFELDSRVYPLNHYFILSPVFLLYSQRTKQCLVAKRYTIISTQ